MSQDTVLVIVSQLNGLRTSLEVKLEILPQCSDLGPISGADATGVDPRVPIETGMQSQEWGKMLGAHHPAEPEAAGLLVGALTGSHPTATYSRPTS